LSETHGIDPAEAFLREVDEAVRQDQWKALWVKYRSVVLIGLAVAALAGAGVSLWRESEARKAASASSRYGVASELADAGKHEDAAIAFEALARQGGIYGAMAQMRQADERVALSDRPAAIKILDQLSADSSAPRDLRDLAALRSVQLNLDSLALDEARRRLNPLTAAGAPYRLTARELLAGAELKAGDTAAAQADLQALLSDPATPPGQRQRAGDLLSSMGVDSTKRP
jgi:hypothetical protein